MNNLRIPQYPPSSRLYRITTGTTQVGHRAISGEIGSTNERVRLRAWALVYPLCILADGNYDIYVSLFAEVNDSAVMALPVEGIAGTKFINLSERTDLIGERATIWLTSLGGDTEERGAVLAAVEDNMIYLLTLDPYVGVERDRSMYLIEDIIHRVRDREASRKLSPTADTMGRLPVLQDMVDLLADTSIDANWYRVTPSLQYA